MADQRQIDLLKQYNDELDRSIELEHERVEAMAIASDAEVSLVEKRQASASAEANMLRQQEQLLQLEDDALKKKIERQKQIIANMEASTDATDDQIEAAKNELLLQQEILKLDKVQRGNLLANIQAKRKDAEAIRDRAEALRETSKTLGELTGVTNQWRNTWVGSLTKIMKANKSGKLSFEELSSAIGETFSAENMAGSAILKIEEAVGAIFIMSAQLFQAQDKAIAQLNVQTGQQNKFNNTLVTTEQNLRRYNIRNEQVAASIAALQQNSVAFRKADEETQQSITQTVASLEKLGVSAQSSTQTFGELTTTFGMTGPAAEQTIKDFVALAHATGLPAETIMSEFPGAAKQLAAFGKQAPKIFADAVKASAAFNLSIQETLGFINQFDTFDKAASSAAALNAILRTNAIDSTTLIRATAEGPVEVQRELVKAFERAGKSFDQLSMFEKKALASRLGISEDILAKLPATEAAFNAQMEATKDTRMEQEQFNEALEAATSLGDSIAALGRQFVVSIEPAIPILKSIVDGLHSFITGVHDLVGFPIIPFIVLLVGAFLGLVGVGIMIGLLVLPPLFSMVASLSSLGVAAPAAAGGLAAVTPVITAFSGALGGAAAPLAAFGIAALKVGFAVLLIGLGIGLAVAGVALLVFALAELLPILAENIGAFLIFMVTMYAFVASLLAMSSASFLIVPSLFAIAAGFAAIGAAMLLMSTDKVLAVASMFEGMSVTVEAFAKIEEPAEIAELLDAASDYNITAVATQLAGAAAPAERLVAAVAGAGAGGGAAAQSTPRKIEIVLNDRVLGRFIDDHLNGKYDPARLSRES